MKINSNFSGKHMAIASKNQRNNNEVLLSLSRSFHKLAHIPFYENVNFPDKDVIILESGHQPNFLPYSGVFKKVFLLDLLVKTQEEFQKVIPFFGFADQNLTTAPFLYSNQLPSQKKEGFEKIGFKVLKHNKYRCFNSLSKPSEQEWEKEMNRIQNFFESGHVKKLSNSAIHERLSELMEILFKSYELSNNFAELNAIIFSKICSDILHFKVNFFLYSDVQKSKLFIDEWRNILENIIIFNKIYNNTIKEYNLPIPLVDQYHVPFWFHCSCGGKVLLNIHEKHEVEGKCPVCGNDINIFFGQDYELLSDYIHKMGTTAVSRNIVFSQGLGTNFFISGSGGSLKYGKISEEIAKKMDFFYPITIIWSSKDLYIGKAHYKSLHSFKESCDLSDTDLIKSQLIDSFASNRNKLVHTIQSTDDLDNRKYLMGRLINMDTQKLLLINVFKTVPSIIDILVNIEKNIIISTWNKCWRDTLAIPEKQIFRLSNELIYPNKILNFNYEDVKSIYRNISSLEGKE